MTHRHGLDLVVGHIQRRRAEAGLQGGNVRAGLDPELGVQVGQWLVHQEHTGLAHDCPAHGHTLALATGQSLRLAVEVRLEVEEPGGLSHLRVPIGLVHALELQGKAHVLGD